MADMPGLRHLELLISALLAAGNRLAWDDGYTDLFKVNQSGVYCALGQPIDFEIARSVPSIPEVVLNEDLDCISCRHCWALIHGGRHNTLMTRRP